MIARLKRTLLDVPTGFAVPRWLVLTAVVAIYIYLARTIDWQPENFAVFLFDYEFGFIRRGLLGTLAGLIPYAPDEYFVFSAFYWAVLLGLYLVVLGNLRLALFQDTAESNEGRVWFSIAILFSPLFLKNLMFDFGRFDSAGYLAVFAFALARPAVQRVLIVALPPVLILCHEGQVLFSVPPMLAIFLIFAIRERNLLKLRTLLPLALSVGVSLGLSVYLLKNGIPSVSHDVIQDYVAGKSPKNTEDRTWLLYDDLQANIEMARGNRRFKWRQLEASPLHVLAFALHLPVTVLLWHFFKRDRDPGLRLSCAVIFATSLAQCVLFFVGIDYARWIANIFISFVAMFLVLVRVHGLGDAVADHAIRNRHYFIALTFIFLAIPKFGVVSP